MKAVGMLEYATDMNNPNFAKMADAIGVFGVRVENPEELEGAVKKAFDHTDLLSSMCLSIVSNCQCLRKLPLMM